MDSRLEKYAEYRKYWSEIGKTPTEPTVDFGEYSPDMSLYMKVDLYLKLINH